MSSQKTNIFFTYFYIFLILYNIFKYLIQIGNLPCFLGGAFGPDMSLAPLPTAGLTTTALII